MIRPWLLVLMLALVLMAGATFRLVAPDGEKMPLPEGEIVGIRAFGCPEEPGMLVQGVKYENGLTLWTIVAGPKASDVPYAIEANGPNGIDDGDQEDDDIVIDLNRDGLVDQHVAYGSEQFGLSPCQPAVEVK